MHPVSPIKLRRQKLTYITGASLSIPSYELVKDPELLRGLPSELVPIPAGAAHEGEDSEGPYSEIIVPDSFPPGSMMVFATSMSGLDPKLDSLCSSGASEAFADLDLVDLNVLVHRADGEERDATGTFRFSKLLGMTEPCLLISLSFTGGSIGVYNVPNLGPLVYCGLEGFMHPLRHVTKRNDLGHPLCGHLREGTWAMDYIHDRLEK